LHACDMHGYNSTCCCKSCPLPPTCISFWVPTLEAVCCLKVTIICRSIFFCGLGLKCILQVLNIAIYTWKWYLKCSIANARGTKFCILGPNPQK
jgi:hypothetical protein